MGWTSTLLQALLLLRPLPCRRQVPDLVLGGVQVAQFYPGGATVVIPGLASRTDLNNVVGIVIATTTAAAERVAIRLASGEKIRVKPANVEVSICPANFT